MSLSSWKARIEDLLYPRRCPVCDRPVRPFGALVCRDCEAVPEKITGHTCARCGRPVGARGEYCPDCGRIPHAYDRGGAVFSYRSVSAGLYRFKYGGRQEYADWYGHLMALRLRDLVRAGALPRPDFLVPVPLSSRRLKKRGYNQALLLARAMSRETGIPLKTDVLARVRDTLPMKDMPLPDRQKNLERAFIVPGNDVRLKSIMLIDDIYTMGTTVDACAEVLRKAGAQTVCFMALAIGESRLC